MQIEKYTDRLKFVLQSAQSLALRSGHQQITPLHVLKALLDDEDRLAANLIDVSGGTAAAVDQGVERELAKLPKVEGGGAGQLYLAPEPSLRFRPISTTRSVRRPRTRAASPASTCCGSSMSPRRPHSPTGWKRGAPAR